MTLQNSINLVINSANPLSATNGGLGVSNPTAHGILVAEGSSAAVSKVLTNGQLLVGSTGADPVAAAITAGAGISVTNGAGTITIAATGANSWVDQTGASVTMAANTSYKADNAGLVTLTLPATAALGDEFEVYAYGAGGFTIAQNAGQSIRFGNQITTTGTGGSLSSTGVGDSVRIVCLVANNEFAVLNDQGTFTIV